MWLKSKAQRFQKNPWPYKVKHTKEINGIRKICTGTYSMPKDQKNGV